MTNDAMEYQKGKSTELSADNEEEYIELFGPEYAAQTGDLRIDFINEKNLPGLDKQVRDADCVWMTMRARLKITLREISTHEQSLKKIEATIVANTPAEKCDAGSAAERKRKLDAIVHSDAQWLIANDLLQQALLDKRECGMDIEDAAHAISVAEIRIRWRTSYMVGGVLVKMGKITPDQHDEAISLV